MKVIVLLQQDTHALTVITFIHAAPIWCQRPSLIREPSLATVANETKCGGTVILQRSLSGTLFVTCLKIVALQSYTSVSLMCIAPGHLY